MPEHRRKTWIKVGKNSDEIKPLKANKSENENYNDNGQKQ